MEELHKQGSKASFKDEPITKAYKIFQEILKMFFNKKIQSSTEYVHCHMKTTSACLLSSDKL